MPGRGTPWVPVMQGGQRPGTDNAPTGARRPTGTGLSTGSWHG